MKRQRRFGTEVEAPAIAAAQIRTLIDSIGHYVQSLDYDIETERSAPGAGTVATRLFQFWREACPPGAIILAATVAALQRRLADAEALTYTPIDSETKLLLPA